MRDTEREFLTLQTRVLLLVESIKERILKTKRKLILAEECNLLKQVSNRVFFCSRTYQLDYNK